MPHTACTASSPGIGGPLQIGGPGSAVVGSLGGQPLGRRMRDLDNLDDDEDEDDGEEEMAEDKGRRRQRREDGTYATPAKGAERQKAASVLVRRIQKRPLCVVRVLSPDTMFLESKSMWVLDNGRLLDNLNSIFCIHDQVQARFLCLWLLVMSVHFRRCWTSSLCSRHAWRRSGGQRWRRERPSAVSERLSGGRDWRAWREKGPPGTLRGDR